MSLSPVKDCHSVKDVCYYPEECTLTRLQQFSATVLFAVGHQRKINSNLNWAVFPQLLSEGLREL